MQSTTKTGALPTCSDIAADCTGRLAGALVVAAGEGEGEGLGTPGGEGLAPVPAVAEREVINDGPGSFRKHRNTARVCPGVTYALRSCGVRQDGVVVDGDVCATRQVDLLIGVGEHARDRLQARGVVTHADHHAAARLRGSGEVGQGS